MKILFALCMALALAASGAATRPPEARAALIPAAAATPIDHVVILFMENRTFDNVFGRYCVQQGGRCDGVVQGKISDGSTIPLSPAPDVQPPLNHSHKSQKKGINKGLMNGFDKIKGCLPPNYACYDTYNRSGIPNVAALADNFAMSDRTFTPWTAATFVAHLELAAGTRNFFQGDNPDEIDPRARPGWGCFSFKDALWEYPQGSTAIYVPSCVPDTNGDGPYRESPVAHVPTIFDRMDGGGLSWKQYIHQPNSAKSMCSYFWSCINSPQASNLVPTENVITDADNGTLPNVSFVIPKDVVSQHPRFSMIAGDNWIGDILEATMNGPDWESTAVFLTWDDCGCFYDHVPPTKKFWGPRIPMVIVSPYAKPGFVDSTPTTFAGMLAFIQHNWGLASLGNEDRNAYDFMNSFDFEQDPLPPIPMVDTPIPMSSQAYLQANPGPHPAL